MEEVVHIFLSKIFLGFDTVEAAYKDQGPFLRNCIVARAEHIKVYRSIPLTTCKDQGPSSIICIAARAEHIKVYRTGCGTVEAISACKDQGPSSRNCIVARAEHVQSVSFRLALRLTCLARVLYDVLKASESSTACCELLVKLLLTRVYRTEGREMCKRCFFT